MGSKWTPGPWTIDIRNAEMVVCGSNHLMTIVHRNINWDNAEEQANAHLIASCPTMFNYIKKKADEGCEDAKSVIQSTWPS